MKMRFAVYEERVAIYLDVDALIEFDRWWGTSPRVSIDVTPTHVFVSHNPDGRHQGVCSDEEPDEWVARYVDVVGEAARCGVHELNFRAQFGRLVADLPWPHELPWPKYFEYGSGNFDKHKAAIRDIRLRRDSLETADGHRQLPLPKHVQLLLTAQERVCYFQGDEI